MMKEKENVQLSQMKCDTMIGPQEWVQDDVCDPGRLGALEGCLVAVTPGLNVLCLTGPDAVTHMISML
jgi:hypothetical protein